MYKGLQLEGISVQHIVWHVLETRAHMFLNDFGSLRLQKEIHVPVRLKSEKGFERLIEKLGRERQSFWRYKGESCPSHSQLSEECAARENNKTYNISAELTSGYWRTKKDATTAP